MSRYSIEYKARNMLIGGTDWRGTAWWYRKADEDALGRPNHFAGFIPVQTVADVLFPTDVILVPTAFAEPCAEGDEDFSYDRVFYRWRWMARKAVIPGSAEGVAALIDPETGLYDPLGVHGMEWVTHQFRQWLLDEVGRILDDDLGITSAGVLRHGRIAWVEVSMPGSITTAEGVEFRPKLLSWTSHDGTYKTTYKKSATDVVCDNTWDYAANMQSESGIYRIPHTKTSTEESTVLAAREALGIMFTDAGDKVSRLIAEWAGHPVAEADWTRVLDKLSPWPDRDDKPRVKGNKERKRGTLAKLWISDPMVAPWRNTKLGVLKAFSTWGHHFQRGAADPSAKAERNDLRALSGHYGQLEKLVSAVLADVQR